MHMHAHDYFDGLKSFDGVEADNETSGYAY